MVAAKENKNRAGEARGELDRSFRGTDLDEVEEVEDETKEGGAIRVLAVTAKRAVGKLEVQIDVTILWV